MLTFYFFKDYRNENRASPVSTTTSAALLNEHMRDKMRSLNSTQRTQNRRTQESSKTEGGVSLRVRGAMNRGAVRSGRRMTRKRSRLIETRIVKIKIYLVFIEVERGT